MPAQLSFAEFDPPQPVEQVVFFALYPDSQTAERVAVLVQRLRERLGLKGSALKTELFHTTLFALGNPVSLSKDRVVAAREAGAMVAAAPFEVEFDHVASFAGRARKHPFVLHGGNGLEKWKDFQRQLGTAALKAGAVQSLPAYAPHMTLLYDEHNIPSQEIEPIRWTASEFSLMRSIHGEGRHEPIKRWPLCG
jgi:RNA 2',3'-cyclic 3'-phosphodiesterase